MSLTSDLLDQARTLAMFDAKNPSRQIFEGLFRPPTTRFFISFLMSPSKISSAQDSKTACTAT
jgi:hypothetical protein